MPNGGCTTGSDGGGGDKFVSKRCLGELECIWVGVSNPHPDLSWGRTWTTGPWSPGPLISVSHRLTPRLGIFQDNTPCGELY